MPRVQALVCRDGKILMAKHREGDRVYWCLPGGALEEGETPAEGALRELGEEACVEGRILRQTGCGLDHQGRNDVYTYLVDIGDQEPRLGHDPEVGRDEIILEDIVWLELREIPERDRAFMWNSGLMNAPGMVEEVSAWGDDISYPGEST